MNSARYGHGSLVPICGVLDIRRNEHGTRPFSGHTRASAPLCLGADSRSDGKVVVIVRYLEHHLHHFSCWTN